MTSDLDNELAGQLHGLAGEICNNRSYLAGLTQEAQNDLVDLLIRAAYALETRESMKEKRCGS